MSWYQYTWRIDFLKFTFRGNNTNLMGLHQDPKATHYSVEQWRFNGGGEGGLAGLEPPPPPPNLLCSTPWYYAWTIQNFINVPIFRVRPRACYVKGTMKGQKSIYSKFISDQLSRIGSSTDSDCTTTHLRGPRIPDPPRWSVCKCALTH